ncbi:MAG: hypothetical protein V2I24_00680 [Halieaceae bacterium]|nr:hypothetical protein [Halieaceae bacterium]
MLTRLFQGWPLFWLGTLVISGSMVSALQRFDPASPEGVSQLIAWSVRWAVPFIFIVTAASALAALVPRLRWPLRNRRMLGLLFAVAMAWQGLFIFLLSTVHSEFYYDDVYFLRDEIEGTCGYLLLVAMTLTSFRFGRRHLTSSQWKTLHRSGTYFLWAYAYTVYWWNTAYYPDPQPIDYLFYTLGLTAFALRIAAWAKRRRVASPAHGAGPLRLFAAGLLAALALVAAATGRQWQEAVSGALTTPPWSATLELWLPYWPFEPFLPLALFGLAAWLLTPGAAAGITGAPVAARVADPA